MIPSYVLRFLVGSWMIRTKVRDIFPKPLCSMIVAYLRVCQGWFCGKVWRIVEHNGRGYAVVLMPYSLCCVSVGGG